MNFQGEGNHSTSNTLPSSNSNSSNLNTFEQPSSLVQPNSEIQIPSNTTDFVSNVYPIYNNTKKNVIQSDSVDNRHEICNISHPTYTIMQDQKQHTNNSSDNLFNFNTLVSAAAALPSLSPTNGLNKGNEMIQSQVKVRW